MSGAGASESKDLAAQAETHDGLNVCYRTDKFDWLRYKIKILVLVILPDYSPITILNLRANTCGFRRAGDSNASEGG